ncbi:MAG: hypothetical protein HAW60_05850 [Bdellovibrionales bacterium]|nr:hypothetical protein [Bdellovibrionales bacterium]
MTNKEMKSALKRIDAYSDDMRKGKIDMSECVKLSYYPPFKDGNQNTSLNKKNNKSSNFNSSIKKNKKNK